VLASGTMLLATDALSAQRTLGFYMLVACDLSSSQLADFAHLHGNSESLLKFGMTYDAKAAQLLNQRVFDTFVQRNITDMQEMMHSKGFDELCNNLTEAERKELSIKWGHETAVYILTIDDIREHYIIPAILQVT